MILIQSRPINRYENDDFPKKNPKNYKTLRLFETFL